MPEELQTSEVQQLKLRMQNIGEKLLHKLLVKYHFQFHKLSTEQRVRRNYKNNKVLVCNRRCMAGNQSSSRSQEVRGRFEDTPRATWYRIRHDCRCQCWGRCLYARQRLPMQKSWLPSGKAILRQDCTGWCRLWTLGAIVNFRSKSHKPE